MSSIKDALLTDDEITNPCRGHPHKYGHTGGRCIAEAQARKLMTWISAALKELSNEGCDIGPGAAGILFERAGLAPWPAEEHDLHEEPRSLWTQRPHHGYDH